MMVVWVFKKKNKNKIAALLVKVYGLLHKPGLHSVFIYKLCFRTEMYVCTMRLCFAFVLCVFISFLFISEEAIYNLMMSAP